MAEHLALAICPKLYLKSVPTIVEVRDSTKELSRMPILGTSLVGPIAWHVCTCYGDGR